MTYKKNNVRIAALVVVAALSISSCTQKETTPEIQGTWVQPIPGMTEQVQGFTLYSDGSAESVNMATLQYTQWSLPEPETLILYGLSIGNGQTIEFCDTLTIALLSSDSLVLHRGELDLTYYRQE